MCSLPYLKILSFSAIRTVSQTPAREARRLTGDLHLSLRSSKSSPQVSCPVLCRHSAVATPHSLSPSKGLSRSYRTLLYFPTFCKPSSVTPSPFPFLSVAPNTQIHGLPGATSGHNYQEPKRISCQATQSHHTLPEPERKKKPGTKTPNKDKTRH